MTLFFNFNWFSAPESLLAPIVHLLFIGSPSAIHRPTISNALITLAATIVTIIIFAVDSISRWTTGRSSDILNKSYKAIAPPLAHLDASGTVIFERDVGRLVAPRFRCLPRIPFYSSKKTMQSSNTVKDSILPLPKQPFRRYFIFQAAAAFTVTKFQSVSMNRSFSAAMAFAPPAPLQALAVKDSQNSPSTELSICKIFAFGWHNAPPLVRSLFEVRGKLSKESERFGLQTLAAKKKYHNVFVKDK